MIDLFTWEDGNGHAPGGGQAQIRNGTEWRLTLPARPTIRGKANTEAEAIAAVESAFREYIVECWKSGTSVRGGWLSPL